MPHALGDAFPVVVECCRRARVRSFKVGRGIHGLLRPDKMIAYFDDVARLRDVAAALTHALSGWPVHGVPFTTDLGGDGLVSWAVDPQGGATGESWRAWLTARLAAAVAATAETPDDDRVERVLGTVRRLGIDPDTWQPHDH